MIHYLIRIGIIVDRMVKKLPVVQEMDVQSLGWHDPLEKEMANPSSLLAWKTHGQRSLVGFSQCIAESEMTE